MLPGGDDGAGQLADAPELIARLASALPEASIFAFDADLRLVEARGPLPRPGSPGTVRRLVAEMFATGSWDDVREHYEATLRGERRTFEYAPSDGLALHRVHFAPLAGPDGAVEGVLAVSHAVGDGDPGRHAIERRLRHQSALADVAGRALEVADPGELLRYACERVADGSGGHGVGLLEADEHGHLRLTAASGLPDAALGRADGLHDALREQSPLILDDGNRERLAEALGDLDGGRPCVLVGLDGGSSASLLVVCRDDGPPDDDDVAFFSAVAGVLAAARERQRVEDELRRAALHDELTGLPNRTALRDHLRLGLARNQRYDTRLAVFFLDLDGFKAVNDEHGHGVGDAVLRDVAGRLQRALRRADLVARFGGDEFVVLCETIAGPHEVEQVVARIHAAFTEPFALDGGSERLGVSVGVAVIGRDTTDPDVALDLADADMYRVKRAAR
jgi:diguanylate cyclase (GGDEF)-like protein